MFLVSRKFISIHFHIFSFFYSQSQFIYQLSEAFFEQTLINSNRIPQVHLVRISSKEAEYPPRYFSYEL